MTITQYHPEYLDAKEDWRVVYDALIGERRVKEQGEIHLPMPSGFKTKEDNGAALYHMYKTRARFGEYTLPTVTGMIGVIHSSEEKMKIELPSQMQYLWENSNNDNVPLEAFHKSLTEALLSYGRVGIRVTAPVDGGEPYLTLWKAPLIINWDDDFVVLDDSQWIRNGFNWDWKEYRRVVERREEGTFSILYDGSIAVSEVEMKGVSGALDMFPFVMVNANGVGLDLTPPPVLGVARAAVSEYQLSADYRWQLYMSGQETLFIINGDAPEAVGAGVVVEIRGETDGKQPDAKYVGPSGAGIEAHRKAMEEERMKAVAAGAKLLQFDSKATESGDALRTRFRNHASTLMGVAQASCQGLEKALRVAAELKGIEEGARNAITVTPPKDLADLKLSGSEAESLVRIWQEQGFSKRSLFENLQRGSLISAERSFEDEEELIDEEEPEGDDVGLVVTPPLPTPPVDQ